MPYSWITPPPSLSDTEGQTDRPQSLPLSQPMELHLWPHQSLPPEGYARFLAGTAVLIALPLLAFLGSMVLWGLLPFLALALFGMKWALDRNRRDAQILEVLTIDTNDAQLERRDASGARQSWQCNRYWTTLTLHPVQGPVPSYVTLRGGGREVEIGAFLSEDERKALHSDLARIFTDA